SPRRIRTSGGASKPRVTRSPATRLTTTVIPSPITIFSPTLRLRISMIPSSLKNCCHLSGSAPLTDIIQRNRDAAPYASADSGQLGAAQHPALKNFREIPGRHEIFCGRDFVQLGNLKMGRTYQIEPDSMCNPAVRLKCKQLEPDGWSQ